MINLTTGSRLFIHGFLGEGKQLSQSQPVMKPRVRLVLKKTYKLHCLLYYVFQTKNQ